MSVDINQLTLQQLHEIQNMFPLQRVSDDEVPAPAYKSKYHKLIGKNVIVRTVTMIYTGKLVSVDVTDLVLVDVAWIPQTERYADFVAMGAVRECEPYPDGLEVIISRGGLLDTCVLSKQLPRSQK